jgi:hypothetical protein
MFSIGMRFAEEMGRGFHRVAVAHLIYFEDSAVWKPSKSDDGDALLLGNSSFEQHALSMRTVLRLSLFCGGVAILWPIPQRRSRSLVAVPGPIRLLPAQPTPNL